LRRIDLPAWSFWSPPSVKHIMRLCIRRNRLFAADPAQDVLAKARCLASASDLFLAADPVRAAKSGLRCLPSVSALIFSRWSCSRRACKELVWLYLTLLSADPARCTQRSSLFGLCFSPDFKAADPAQHAASLVFARIRPSF
jgi:hypothetical protein